MKHLPLFVAVAALLLAAVGVAFSGWLLAKEVEPVTPTPAVLPVAAAAAPVDGFHVTTPEDDALQPRDIGLTRTTVLATVPADYKFTKIIRVYHKGELDLKRSYRETRYEPDAPERQRGLTLGFLNPNALLPEPTDKVRLIGFHWGTQELVWVEVPNLKQGTGAGALISSESYRFGVEHELVGINLGIPGEDASRGFQYPPSDPMRSTWHITGSILIEPLTEADWKRMAQNSSGKPIPLTVVEYLEDEE